jgi:hypothetical protein
MTRREYDPMALEVLLQTGGELGKSVFPDAKIIASVPAEYNYVGGGYTDLDYDVIETLLKRGIAEKMEKYDEVGLLLSGGVDSTLLAWLITKYTDTKVIGYHTDWKYDPRSEVIHARKAAALCGIELREIDVSPERQIPFIDEALSRTKAIDFSIIAAYMAFKAMESDGIKFGVNALGMDEMFAGYTSHRRLYERYSMARPKLFPYVGIKYRLCKAMMRRFGSDRAYFISNFFVNPGTSFVEHPLVDANDIAKNMYKAMKADTLWNTVQRWTLWHMNDNYADHITRAGAAAGVAVIFPYIMEALFDYAMNLPPELKKNKYPQRFFMGQMEGIPQDLVARGSDWSDMSKWDKMGWGGVVKPYTDCHEFMNAITPSCNSNNFFSEASVQKYVSTMNDRPQRVGMQMIIFLKIMELLS